MSETLYNLISVSRPSCPISGKRGVQVHHALIERGASGLPKRKQHWIHQPWNCVLLSLLSHDRLHTFDPSLNNICIKALVDFYGEDYLSARIAEIPFRIPTTLAQIKARNEYP